MGIYTGAWEALRKDRTFSFSCYIVNFEKIKKGIIKAKVEQVNKSEEEKFLKLIVVSKVKRGNQYDVILELRTITKTRGGVYI